MAKATGALQHVLVLLKKNYYLYKARKATTVVQLIMPSIFLFLMVLVSLLIPYPAHEPHPRAEPVSGAGVLPPCIAFATPDCWHLTVVPRADPVVDQIVLGAITRLDIPQTSVKYMDTEAELVDWLEKTPNQTQAAVVFDVATLQQPGEIKYRILINGTNGQQSGVINAYQVAIDAALFDEVTGTPGHIFKLLRRGWPRLKQAYDGKVASQAQNGVLFFYIAQMLQFMATLGNVVSEKEHRLRLGMSMMGMKQSSYWLHWLVTTVIINTVAIVLMMLVGAILSLDVITNANVVATFIVHLVFGLTMACEAFLLSTFLKSSRSATTIGFLVVAFGFLLLGFFGVPQSTYLVFQPTVTQVPRWILVLFFPPFSFSKCYCDIVRLSVRYLDGDGNFVKGVGFSWSDLYNWRADVPGNVFTATQYALPPTVESIYWLLFNAACFLVIAGYLDSVLPGGETGVQRPPWFLFTKEFWGLSRGDRERPAIPSEEFLRDLDDDVQREIRSTFQQDPSAHTIAVCDMKKAYGFGKNRKVAVEGVSYCVDEGTVFGLLGHNGAGKTSTINMLIGLFQPSSGDAYIRGKSVVTELDSIRHHVGVCPQHDILWDDLTARQHLTIFAEFKGLSRTGGEIDREIHRLLEQVNLLAEIDNKVRTFSGGMKRRMSVAVANVGSPTVLFLDEPTTGMDPHSRRQVWQLIQQLKQGRAVLLTTHSMEEADALSDRLAIMVRGQLRCIGGSLQLKNKFGKGYQIKTVCSPDRGDEMRAFFSKHLPQATYVSDNAGAFIYNMPGSELAALPPFIEQLEAMVQGSGTDAEADQRRLVRDWGISQTTLEEVYLTINHKFHVYEQPAEPLLEGSTPKVTSSTEEETAIRLPSPATVEKDTEARQWGSEEAKLWVPKEGEERASYPMRALLRKNWSFQRRQPFTVCCLVAFPVFIVLFVLLLQALVNALNDSSGGSSGDGLVRVEPPPFAVLYNSTVCTEPTAGPKRDTCSGNLVWPYYYTPAVGSNTIHPAPWLVVSGNAGSLLGSDQSNNGSTNGTLEGVLLEMAYTISRITCPACDTNSGPRYLNNLNAKWYPFFDSVTFADEQALDDYIYERAAEQRGIEFKNQDKAFAALNFDLSHFPILAFEVNQLNVTRGSPGTVEYTVRINNNSFTFGDTDSGPWLGAVNTTVQDLQLATASNLLHTALLRNITNNQWSISLEVQQMPYDTKSTAQQLVDFLAALFYPIVFLFPMPFFLFHIVYEKEFRLRELMKMNAMQMRHYWLSTLLFDFAVYWAICIVFLILMAVLRVRWIEQTSFALIFLLLLGMSLCSVTVPVFLSALISKATTAKIMGFVLLLIIWILGFVIETLKWQGCGCTPSFFYMIFPPFAFAHGLVTSLNACGDMRCATAKDMGNADYASSLVYLFLDAPLYLLLGLYLDQVLPSQWGVRKPPLFFIGAIRAFFSGQSNSSSGGYVKQRDERAPLLTNSLGADGGFAGHDFSEDDAALRAVGCFDPPAHEDPDVRLERERVVGTATAGTGGKPYDVRTTPIMIRGLHKNYGTLLEPGKVAVKRLDLAIERDQCFGLLGPNGAGKTTTISMLSGMFGPTAGTAFIEGFDIRSEMDQIHTRIGLCPQHDVLWDKHLTVEEHLLFFARLKGVPPASEKAHVLHWLRRVRLDGKRDRLPKALSGGEQRRLSIAIALVGSPSVAFFDEPTTGLDPTARRHVWDIITDAKRGRCLVLTTHSMEEAEVLSDRIGIMATGRLRCLGTPLRLKNKFGKGFRITLAFREEDREKAVRLVQSIVPSAVEVGLPIRGTTTLEFDPSFGDDGGKPLQQQQDNKDGEQDNKGGVSLARLFQLMEDGRGQAGVLDWGVSQTSMEDVFLQIIKTAEEEEATALELRREASAK
eukprot:TRINITY_DN10553_c0_g1_i1.p1 TRINITY_DN10553_c0_g1~~TRINITY_DN10553_c0_g1_i1.p1  ORF type:complete len:1882 (+),score=415.75 TRINITY_DN10553_c0_g1_i1:109-5754(+)